MKHIGIVACSAEGAALCYREICRQGIELVGKHDHPRVTLDSIPLARWMPAFDARDHEGVAEVMLESVRLLADAGAELAICPDNSAHLAFAWVEAGSPIPWLHIGRVVADRARRDGFRRVGVLGTRFITAGPVYPEALGAVGIEAVPPDDEDAELIDRIIFDELVDGVFSDASRAPTRASSSDSPVVAATRSPSRAPRSRCSSRRRTRPCPPSTRPGSSPPPPSSTPAADPQKHDESDRRAQSAAWTGSAWVARLDSYHSVPTGSPAMFQLHDVDGVIGR